MCFWRLRDEVDWQQRTIRIFGREHLQPRLISFMGDAGIRYRYSGGCYDAAPWHPLLSKLLRLLERDLGIRFNSVLANLYRDGRDAMGWHADDELELGRAPTIASLSLGAVRRFMLRARADRARKFELQPQPGSLLIMRGGLQQYWQHQVPKTARPVGARINLTFRRIVSDPG